MIGIVDYGMGNLLSVYSAFDYLGANVIICKHPEELSEVGKIVIPGVGAFKDCMELLKKEHFDEALNEQVIKIGKPTIGICLGMQVMAKKSFEGGVYGGLGWFDADVIKLTITDEKKRVPNIGWNEVSHTSNPLFEGVPENTDFYFVHSYFVNCHDSSDVIATYPYDIPVTASILKNNIFATQFHPEKSQDFGLKILDNFISWNP